MVRGTSVARARRMWGRVTSGAAAVAGTTLRLVSLSGPSIGGAVLISYGLGEIYKPLMWIAAGGFLLLADRKLAMDRREER